MSEMNIEVEVFYEENDLPVFPKHTFKCFEPLADHSINSYDERINKTLEKLEVQDRGPKRYRMELLHKLYGDYLIAESATMISPFHHKFTFITGSGGMEFAKDFSLMIATYPDVTLIKTRVNSFDYFYEEDGSLFEMSLEIDNANLWRKSALEQ